MLLLARGAFPLPAASAPRPSCSPSSRRLGVPPPPLGGGKGDGGRRPGRAGGGKMAGLTKTSPRPLPASDWRRLACAGCPVARMPCRAIHRGEETGARTGAGTGAPSRREKATPTPHGPVVLLPPTRLHAAPLPPDAAPAERRAWSATIGAAQAVSGPFSHYYFLLLIKLTLPPPPLPPPSPCPFFLKKDPLPRRGHDQAGRHMVLVRNEQKRSS